MRTAAGLNQTQVEAIQSGWFFPKVQRMTKFDFNNWVTGRKTQVGCALVSAAIGSLRLAAESAPVAQKHIDIANIHPESTAPVHHREAESALYSRSSYELLFADDSRAVSSTPKSWVTQPSKVPFGSSKQASRGHFQRATFSQPETANPEIHLGAAIHSVVPTGSSLVGYLVEVDPSYKNGLRIPDGAEYGQHITLAGGPLALGQVAFPYYSSVSASQALTFSLYTVGVGGLPDSLLYRSSPQDVNQGIYNVSISYGGSVVPEDLIFSVKFSGIGSSANAGLLLPNADPVLGKTTGQVLANQDGTWSQHSVGGGLKGAISISVTAATVPEPQTAVLGLLGIGFLWMASRYRR